MEATCKYCGAWNVECQQYNINKNSICNLRPRCSQLKEPQNTANRTLPLPPLGVHFSFSGPLNKGGVLQNFSLSD